MAVSKRVMAYLNGLKNHEDWVIGLWSKYEPLCEIIRSGTGFCPGLFQEAQLCMLIQEHGPQLVTEAVVKAIEQYDCSTVDGFDFAMAKVGGICFNMTHITCRDCKHLEGYERSKEKGDGAFGILCQYIEPYEMSMFKACKRCDHYEPGQNSCRWY